MNCLGRAIEIHGLPSSMRTAKADNLAKPGLLRNSGGIPYFEFSKNLRFIEKLYHKCLLPKFLINSLNFYLNYCMNIFFSRNLDLEFLLDIFF